MNAEIVSRSWPEPVGRHVRPAGFAILAAAALVSAMSAEPAVAAATATQAEEISAQPQWISPDGQRPAQHLIGLLQSADLDGLDPKRFNVVALKRAVIAAESGGFAAADKANAMLDAALLSYVKALRTAPARDWIVNDREAVPRPPSADELLGEAARAPSLEMWLKAMP